MEEKELFTEDNIPTSSWFKFNKVGDRVMGEVVSIADQPSNNPMYADQMVFALKQKDGSVVNVGVKKTSSYLMGRTKGVENGDILGFEFKAEIPAKTKGYNPAKSIECYLKKCEVSSSSVQPVDEFDSF